MIDNLDLVKDLSTNGYSNGHTLPDVQKTLDRRNKAINRVGVSGITLPMLMNGKNIVARISAYTGLPHNFKGTHMSRFVINAVKEFSNKEVSDVLINTYLSCLKESLQSDDAFVDIEFDYLYSKRSPVTGLNGGYQTCKVSIIGLLRDTIKIVKRLEVTTSSLCPCSKEMSLVDSLAGVGKGAHNQRSVIRCDYLLHDGCLIDMDDLIYEIEDCGSVALYPILKREDEKFVTETAYGNPKFVEDIVRDVALLLDNYSGIKDYSIKVENFESIHQHNALAYLKTPNWELHL